MITFLNPHADDFIAEPVSFKIARRRALKKYHYLISEQLKRKQRVQILVDGTLSSLFPQTIFSAFPKWLRKLILKIEIKKWLDINGLHGKVDIHWSLETIKDTSVLYFFSYKNCTGAFDARLGIIESFDLKVINLSHFMIRSKEKGRNIKRINNVVFTSEADLSETPFFEKYFGSGHRIIALPFMVADRFQEAIPFDERQDMCGATGSFHQLQYEKPQAYYQDFINFFNSQTYHPVRQMLYQHQDEMSDDINCKVSPYRERGHHLLARFDIMQRNYFSFDIVEFYNQHKYALVGEEIHGLSGIGSFEAMACGCVLLTQKGDFYKGLGIEPGVHCFENDGTIEGIRNSINWLRQHPDESQKIANNAKNYIRNNCQPSQLWDTLNARISAYKKGI